MTYKLEWRPSAIDDVNEIFEYLAVHASLWDAEYVTDRILSSADRLVEFPRLYEADPRFGDGVRRLSVVGQHVLYEVDDASRMVNILAVVGQRQRPSRIRV